MRIYLTLLFVILSFTVPAQGIMPKSIYGFKVTALNGSTIDFSEFKGKKILIVNTTILNTDNKQYAELEALSQKYKGKLVIVGFLTVDFLKPPGGTKDFTPRDISEYKVTFPLAAPTIVGGKDIAPIYKWLTRMAYNQYKETRVKWDFQKYLIDENGQLIAEFDPNTHVTDAKVIQAIEN